MWYIDDYSRETESTDIRKKSCVTIFSNFTINEEY